MTQDRSVEARIAEIEAKLMLAEDLLDALNHTQYRQQQQIERLQQEARVLRDALADAGRAESLLPRDELPPHY
jgi:SlyX protein